MTEQIAAQGVRDGMQRRRHKEQPLTARQKRSNKHVAKTRARLEHVFGAMQQMAGKLGLCVKLKRADVAIKIKASIYPYAALSLSAGGCLGSVLGVNLSVVQEQGTGWLKPINLGLFLTHKASYYPLFIDPIPIA